MKLGTTRAKAEEDLPPMGRPETPTRNRGPAWWEGAGRVL